MMMMILLLLHLLLFHLLLHLLRQSAPPSLGRILLYYWRGMDDGRMEGVRVEDGGGGKDGGRGMEDGAGGTGMEDERVKDEGR